MQYFKFNIDKELTYKTSKSSGKGGQHVNKTETKVEVCFDVEASIVLPEDIKKVIAHKLENKLNQGVLCVVCYEDRSQLRNKEKARQKIYNLLEKALIPIKKRRATKPTKTSVAKKKHTKIAKSEIKQLRKKLKI